MAVVVGGERVEGEANLLLIIKARNKVRWSTSGGSRWQQQQEEDRYNADHHKNLHQGHCRGRSSGRRHFHSPGIIPNRVADTKPELPGPPAAC